MTSIRVKILKEGAKLPTYGSAEAAGADLYACLEEELTILPGKTAFVPTGIALEVPKGCAGLIYARSGLACKRGLAPANKVGVVDSDYRGEILVALHNHGTEPQTVGTPASGVTPPRTSSSRTVRNSYPFACSSSTIRSAASTEVSSVS